MNVTQSGARKGDLIRVFAIVLLAYAYFMPRWADWNIDSRLDLVHAIVDQGTLRIDRTNANTWDKAVYKGHFYSDKAPGTAMIGAAVYAGYRLLHRAPGTGYVIDRFLQNSAWKVPIQLGRESTQNSPAPKGTNLGGCQRGSGPHNVQYIPWGNRLVPPMRDWALSKYVVSVVSVSLPSALFAAFFFWFVSVFVRRRWVAWLATLLPALCTVALPYSTNFYSHQLSAAALFVAFALMYLWRAGRKTRWFPAVSGFLLGFACFTEYTVALLAGCIFVYAAWVMRRDRTQILAFMVAGAVPMLALFVYNSLAFSGPLDTGYSHDFCWSSAQAAGYAGFTYPKAGALFDLTFGSFRGMFYLSPFLLFALPGLVEGARRGYGVEVGLCVGMAVLFIVTLSAYWGWNGGKVEGPRYLVPIVPFLAFACVFLFDALPGRAWAWVGVAAAIAWSVFATWAEFLGGQLFPISSLRDPIFQYSLPMLRNNQIAPNAGLFLGLSGWMTLVPLALLLLLLSIPGKSARGSVRSASVRSQASGSA